MTGTASGLPIDGRGKRAALVVACFHREIAESLAEGARRALVTAGLHETDIEEYHVAGSFELAPAVRQLLSLESAPDVVVTLGAVIRGETPHFDFVAQAASGALQRLAVESNVAIGFGVLTTDTREQAARRADPEGMDKGGEAARAALAQVALYEALWESRAHVPGFRAS